ncbi:MAG: ABC transporter ATP-binding protein/permease [Defluviitaleaceae bacterium]|nr:ABC transporter ATP-binding protein/permease [Defluviitaleaceae bacterium]
MLKNFLPRIREYKKDLILSALFSVIGVVFEAIIPFVVSLLVEYGIEAYSMPNILRIGSILVLISLTSLIFGFINARTLASASAGFAKNIRKDMYYHINNFSFKNLDNLTTAGLVTRLTTDVASVQNVFQMAVRIVFRSPFLLIFSLIMAFSINATLALVFLLVLPVLGVLMFFIIKKAFPLFKIALKKYDELNQVVSENLKGIRVVKSFVREDFEVKKFKVVSGDIQSSFSRAEKIVVFFQPSMQFAINVCILLIAWFGAQFVVLESMTIGQLMAFILYINQILFSLIMLSMLFIQLAMARANAERIVEVFEEKIDLLNSPNARKNINLISSQVTSEDENNSVPFNKVSNIENNKPSLEQSQVAVAFENVYFGYSKGKYALKNINLTINQGEFVGILGGTGSSKTSLISLIPRLYDVDQGSVKAFGIDVRELDMGYLRDQVSVVLQKNTLFSGTVKENMLWGNKNATAEEIEHACKIAQAHSFVSKMKDGYDTVLEQGGANLSGGQRQRLCIARALLKNPKIIIFDDSTSAVDTATEAEILKGLKENLKGTTVIIISQRISSVQKSDKIVLMDNKEIVGQGSHEYLLNTNEIYKEIYKSQSKEDAA